MLIQRDFQLKLSLKGLHNFYRRNNVRFLAVGYIYQQAIAKAPAAVENFAVGLAKVIASGEPLVYFDEASFNLWLRGKRTWTPKEMPVKYPLNKNRGSGITVMGAISQHLGKPLFTLEKSTNSAAFQTFLKKLRKRFPLKQTRVHIVLDNASAHVTAEVRVLAADLNFQLMFMPPYTPEFNCIEALWSVIKRDFKRRVLEMQQVVIGDGLFRQLLQDSLDAIMPKV
jgi:transposase